MKILVTGGSGFIGKNLVEYLSQKHEVLAPSHNELDLVSEKDVDAFFQKEMVDTVIHCAVKPGHRNAEDPSEQLYHNTRMFFSLARNSDKFQKMIYLGSGLVYDQRNYEPKMKEEYFDKHVPEDEGGFSKYIISKYIESHKNIVELRVFGIFGKHEDYAIRFISNLACKAVYDLPLTMNQDRMFDYIYIDDLMPIMEHFIENTPKNFNIFNVTPDKAIELLSLAEKIKEISGKELPIVVKKDGLGVEYSGDNLRLKEEMPNLKFMPIEDAIKDLYEWYTKNKKNINKKLLLEDK